MPGLYDMYDEQQPRSFTDALASQRNSLVGLGLGMMSAPTMAMAMQGYEKGAGADAANERTRRQAFDAAEQRKMMREEHARAQANADRAFNYQKYITENPAAVYHPVEKTDFGTTPHSAYRSGGPGGTPSIVPLTPPPSAPDETTGGGIAPGPSPVAPPNFGPVPYGQGGMGGGGLGTGTTETPPPPATRPQFAEPQAEQPPPQPGGWPASPYGQAAPATGGAPTAPASPSTRGPISISPGSSLQGITGEMKRRLDLGETPEQVRDSLPPQYAEYIKALQEGTAIPTNLGRASVGFRNNVMQMAHILGLDETNINARRSMRQAEVSNAPMSPKVQIRRTGTIMEHINSGLNNLDVVEPGPKDTYLGKPLGDPGYGEIPEANRVQDDIIRRSGDKNFNKAQCGYETDSTAVADELGQLLGGSTQHEAERARWLNRFDLSKNSVSSVRGAWAEAYRIMHGRLTNIAREKDQVYGTQTEPISLLGPEHRAIAERVLGQGAARGTGGISGQRGGGGTSGGWKIERVD